ncbi:DUF86 domain-containing protein [Chroococcidiopsis sp. FACHB-1243]|nr:DUF86 domain-containing protein [Chroococcidiopsis sp. [FACHB-1243]]
MREYQLYLADILEYAQSTQNMISGASYDRFEADERTYKAVTYNLQIIGEAVLNIPQDVKQRYPEVEWEDIGRARNLIAHGYYKVKREIIWKIAQNDVPALQTQIERIIELEKLSENQSFIEQSSSTASSARSIYPQQQERAAAIIPIARRLLEAGRTPNSIATTQQIEQGVEELEIEDYKLRFEAQTKTLLITTKDKRGILIRAKLEEQTETLDLANKLTPKDINKWLTIEQQLNKSESRKNIAGQLLVQQSGSQDSSGSPSSIQTDVPTIRALDPIQRTLAAAIYPTAMLLFQALRNNQQNQQLGSGIEVAAAESYQVRLDPQIDTFSILAQDGRGEIVRAQASTGKILHANNINGEDIEHWENISNLITQQQPPLVD